MFDISALKEMKLSELQEIAKSAKTIKFNGVKKETLISQILEHQSASNNSALDKNEENKKEEEKSKRVRIVPVKKGINPKAATDSLFSNEDTTIIASSDTPAEVVKREEVVKT